MAEVFANAPEGWWLIRKVLAAPEIFVTLIRVISVRVDATKAVTGVETLGASWANREPAT